MYFKNWFLIIWIELKYPYTININTNGNDKFIFRITASSNWPKNKIKTSGHEIKVKKSCKSLRYTFIKPMINSNDALIPNEQKRVTIV